MPDNLLDENLLDLNITTCEFAPCTEQNVLQCRKCKKYYCVMHSNKFSPNFCQECFKNLASIEQQFTRTFDDYDVKTNQLKIKKETHTRYFMDGMDWPFLGLWIRNLSDEELRTMWVFHFSVMKTIEVENEVRRVEKFQKLRGQSQQFISSRTTTTKVTTKVTKAPDTAEDVKKKLRKQGIPENIIDMMIKTMGVK